MIAASFAAWPPGCDHDRMRAVPSAITLE